MLGSLTSCNKGHDGKPGVILVRGYDRELTGFRFGLGDLGEGSNTGWLCSGLDVIRKQGECYDWVS